MKNKTIVICGGLGEIGEHFWKTHPDNYYILIDIKDEPENIKTILTKYIYIKADISKGKELQEKVNKEFNKKGIKVDVMLNTPYYNSQVDISETTFEQIDRTYKTKVYGYTNLIKVFLPYFNEDCSVVNIGSVHGARTKSGNSIYAASNSAIEGLTRGLVTEFPGRYRFNVVSPGGILSKPYKDRYPEDWQSKLQRGQIQTLDSIVNVIEFLFDEKSKGINGENITVDGGVSAKRAESKDW